MQTIVAFVLVSSRCQEEINRLAWADLDEEGSRACRDRVPRPMSAVDGDRLNDP